MLLNNVCVKGKHRAPIEERWALAALTANRAVQKMSSGFRLYDSTLHAAASDGITKDDTWVILNEMVSLGTFVRFSYLELKIVETFRIVSFRDRFNVHVKFFPLISFAFSACTDAFLL
jgi:hypothetical protein